MQFQLQMVSLTQMTPFSAHIKWSHYCRRHLVYARSNGVGPVFRVTGDVAARGVAWLADPDPTSLAVNKIRWFTTVAQSPADFHVKG